MSPLKVSYKDPAELRRRDRNPRTHTPNQTKQIAASIKEFGFINPVLIDGSNGIIAGHGRVEAAKLLGMGDIPTVCGQRLPPRNLTRGIAGVSHRPGNRTAENPTGWLTTQSCGEPVSAAKNREKYREISISRMESRTSCFAGADFAGISWPFAHNK